MGWFRRSRLFYNVFRVYNLKNTSTVGNPLQKPCWISRTNQFCTSSSKPNIFKFSQPIFRFQQNQVKSPFLDGAKRFYYIDKGGSQHFKQRGWYRDRRNVTVVFLLSSGIIVSVVFGNLETVPYTKRTHLVLMSVNGEKQLGEQQLDMIKKQYKGRILPPLHPDHVRVQYIARDIIGAVQRGMHSETKWSDTRHLPESFMTNHEAPRAFVDEVDNWHVEDSWKSDDDVIEIEKSRKKGQEKGKKSQTGHLEGLKWEVMVVNEPQINAFCAPGGKIVVFTGLLNHFKTDAEIATVIGHEVAHAVARHNAEQMTKNIWMMILQLILSQFIIPDIVNTMSTLLLKLPFSRRMEMEADYIGLLLLASAGYDPRVGPLVYEKLGRITGEVVLQDYLTTHPSARTRAEALSHAQVMKEAIDIYRDVIGGRGGHGFL